MSALLCFSTCPDAATAERIATDAGGRTPGRLRQRAARAALGGHRWNDAVERAGEVLLLIKTRAGLPGLQQRLLQLHPYELPGLVAVRNQPRPARLPALDRRRNPPRARFRMIRSIPVPARWLRCCNAPRRAAGARRHRSVGTAAGGSVFVLSASADARPDRGRLEDRGRLHLYRHRTKVESPDGSFPNATLSATSIGHKHHDEFFGEVKPTGAWRRKLGDAGERRVQHQR